MKAFIVVAMLAFVGCGGQDSPLVCHLGEKTDVFNGAWKVQKTQVSGNCGTVTDSVEIVGGGENAAAADINAPTCLTDERVLQTDHCAYMYRNTCTWNSGLHAVYVYHWEEVSESELSGTESMLVYGPTGNFVCKSVYNVSSTKM